MRQISTIDTTDNVLNLRENTRRTKTPKMNYGNFDIFVSKDTSHEDELSMNGHCTLTFSGSNEITKLAEKRRTQADTHTHTQKRS